MNTDWYAKVSEEIRKALEPDKKTWASPREKQGSKEGDARQLGSVRCYAFACIMVKSEGLGTTITH